MGPVERDTLRQVVRWVRLSCPVSRTIARAVVVLARRADAAETMYGRDDWGWRVQCGLHDLRHIVERGGPGKLHQLNALGAARDAGLAVPEVLWWFDGRRLPSPRERLRELEGIDHGSG